MFDERMGRFCSCWVSSSLLSFPQSPAPAIWGRNPPYSCKWLGGWALYFRPCTRATLVPKCTTVQSELAIVSCNWETVCISLIESAVAEIRIKCQQSDCYCPIWNEFLSFFPTPLLKFRQAPSLKIRFYKFKSSFFQNWHICLARNEYHEGMKLRWVS